METGRKVVTHFGALAPQRVKVSPRVDGAEQWWLCGVTGKTSLLGRSRQKMADWDLGRLSSVKHIHSAMALCSIELPYPARKG